MLIAGFKASLVVWYFMHVKYQSHLTKLTVATGLFFLAILLGMSLIDYVSRDNFRGRDSVAGGGESGSGRCRDARGSYTRAKRFDAFDLNRLRAHLRQRVQQRLVGLFRNVQ